MFRVKMTMTKIKLKYYSGVNINNISKRNNTLSTGNLPPKFGLCMLCLKTKQNKASWLIFRIESFIKISFE